MPSPARLLAFQLLERQERGGTTLDELLAAPECEALDTRERGFLHELVLGSLRQRGALDHALRPLLDRPLEEVDAPLRSVLRLGAHQILHLRVPDRAAVSESVELARVAAPRGAGFVNAVLRRLARDGAPSVPDPTGDPLGWLTTAGSLPAWLAERWLRQLGPETAVARARTLLRPAPGSLRLNPRHPEALERLTAMGVELQPSRVPGAYVVVRGEVAAARREGLVYVQDAGSQLVAWLAADGRGPLLDACAAPGGKSLLCADLLEGELVVAAESSPRRLRRLAQLTGAWGSPGLRVVGADALTPPFRKPFATVLLDAPCSGLGTLARHPDIRWRAEPADVERQARRQGRLLEQLSPFVRAGGRLVYSVCSLEPEEGTEVVGRFLSQHAEFQPLAAPAWAADFSFGRYMATLPERDGGDGFFAAVLQRA